MKMLKVLAVLLLLAPFAARSAAQVNTYPPQSSGGGSFTGGAITAPILGPTGCVNPAYSFDSQPTYGLCLDTQVYVRAKGAGTELSYLELFPSGGLNLVVTNALGSTAFINLDPATPTISLSSGVGDLSLTPTGFSSTVPFLASTGSAAAPSYSFSAATGTGFLHLAPGIGFAVAGTQYASLISTSFDLASALQLRWSTDTGLARLIAGAVKVTDGGAGIGELVAFRIRNATPPLTIGASGGGNVEAVINDNGLLGLGGATATRAAIGFITSISTTTAATLAGVASGDRTFQVMESGDKAVNVGNGLSGTAAAAEPTVIVRPAAADTTQYNQTNYYGSHGGNVTTLTDNVATTFFHTAALTAGQIYGGSGSYVVRVVDAANETQVESGQFHWYAMRGNTGGTVAGITDFDALNAVSSGTLGVSFTVSIAAEVVSFQITADTTLTPTSFNVTSRANVRTGPAEVIPD